MRYSFNAVKGYPKDEFAFAYGAEINASYKDLGAVCAAIRYMRAADALGVIDGIESMKMPILYLRHNKHMGARHELGGRKGAYPVKAAKEVKRILLNAIANAKNNALDGEEMLIVHAAANKTHIERRQPSKGSLAWGRGMYGRSAINHSDIEYAKVEIVLADKDYEGLTGNMKYFTRKKAIELARKTVRAAPAAKPATKQKQAQKAEAKEAKGTAQVSRPAENAAVKPPAAKLHDEKKESDTQAKAKEGNEEKHAQN